MAHDGKHVPIFCLDVQGFTTYDTTTQRTIIRRLQHIATEAARFFAPYCENAWTKWTRHGTGDGYYFVFDTLPPQVALQFALNIDAALAAHNAQHGQALAIRLYGALVLGDVELVGDQYLSAAFSEAARFLSHQPFKNSLAHQERPMVLAMSALFHSEWREDVRRHNAFPDTAPLQWTPFTCHDKHGYRHEGYVLGPGWTEETAVPSDLAEVEAGAESAEPVIPPAISLAVVSTGAAQETIQYTGQSKVNLCRELVSDWQDLADYFAIPPFTRARFDRGREPQGVWEWLETRRRLSELPGALVFIGRDELLEVLQTRPR